MDKFSYAIGLGIGQKPLSMGARGIEVKRLCTGYQRRIRGKPNSNHSHRSS